MQFASSTGVLAGSTPSLQHTQLCPAAEPAELVDGARRPPAPVRASHMCAFRCLANGFAVHLNSPSQVIARGAPLARALWPSYVTRAQFSIYQHAHRQVG